MPARVSVPLPKASPDPAVGGMLSAGHFLREALRAPFRVGAVAPSLPAVGRLLVETARLREAEVIVELGAGAGSITREILAAKSPRARLLAVERNAVLAERLSASLGGAVVACACATQLTAAAAARGITRADAIVSTLPWTVLPAESQIAVLEGVRSLLRPGGIFATAVCFGLNLTRPGREFRDRLRTTFPGVRSSRVEWRNVPPMVAYYAQAGE